MVTDIIVSLEQDYGKMQVTRGLTHDYLGMTLDFSQKGSVKINMTDYISSILADATEFKSGVAKTPASNDLFNVEKTSPPLDAKRSQRFHTITAKLLFLAKRGRPDILTAVAFLTTRVSCPSEEDTNQLDRVLMYLRHTPDLILTLQADGSGNINWRADGSFAVHPDMKSHTGGTGTLGKGSF